MSLFKSKAEKQLDSILQRMAMNLSNNYKDNAQDNLREFESTLEELRASGGLKASSLAKYESILGIYQEKLKGYSHKDQKPYWH